VALALARCQEARWALAVGHTGLIEDQEGKYPAGTQWEFVEEEMRVVPW